MAKPCVTCDDNTFQKQLLPNVALLLTELSVKDQNTVILSEECNNRCSLSCLSHTNVWLFSFF